MRSLTVRMQTLRGLFGQLTSIVMLTALFTAVPFHSALAQGTAPSLGGAQSFAVLGSSTVTNTGPTVITGDLGVRPGTAITGFPPGTVTGATHSGPIDPVALQAQNDNTTAYNNLAGQACNFSGPTDLGGKTLVPGVYCFSSTAQLTGALTLDAGGDTTAVWVFKIGSTLTTASNSSVVLINGAQNCNVFWQVGSSATIGTGTTFVGNILALTSITLNTNVIMSGRALAQNGAVTMDSNTVAISVCAVPAINPTLGKAFSPATVNAGVASTLTITLHNPNSTPATASGFTDTLPTVPSGLVVSGTATTNCGGTVTNNTTSVTLTGGTIPANGSCTVTVDVTSPVGGSFINCLDIGALHTGNGNNLNLVCATLAVTPSVGVVPPTISKAFSPATTPAGGGTSTLTITLVNPNSATATGSGFTDGLPSGVLVAAGAQINGCGGTLTATVGGSTVILAGAIIPANSVPCAVTVPVTATLTGTNILAAGALQTSNGSNLFPATATLTVPPASAVTISKAFNLPTINAGGTSTLTITLINTNGTLANAPSPLTDSLPAGLVVAAGSTTNNCNGSLSAIPGTSAVTLTGGSLPANSSCTVTVQVTAAVGGNYINVLAGASATLTVIPPVGVAPPTLSKAFSPATISAGGTSILTITLSNPNSAGATLTTPLTDTLPPGVVVDGSATSTCNGSFTLTAKLGGSTVTLTGGSIPISGSCTVTVRVTSPVGGTFINSLAAGALQTNKGINAAPAVATLTVNAPALPRFVQGGKSNTWGASGNSGRVVLAGTASGDLLVVFGVAPTVTSSAHYSCSDTLGNSYTVSGGTSGSGFSGSKAAFCWTINRANGNDAITFRTSENPNDGVSMTVAEYSNIAAFPLDLARGSSSVPYGTSQATPTITTTNANDLIIAAVVVGKGGGTLSIAGYTIQNGGSSSDEVAMADKDVTVMGSQSGTWTWPIKSNSTTSIIAFKAR